MRHLAVGLIAVACLLGACTGRVEAVRAAQPHQESFDALRYRALDLLELRADVERKKLLFAAASGDEDALPDNLRPLLEQMRAANVKLTQAEIDRGEALFWRMLDLAFSETPEVLQGEIVFLEKDGSISRFRYPRGREAPAGVEWHGLRQQRTFAGLTRCVTEDGSEPCVLIQRRPREHSGSAGLTVGFRHAP
jgi:hypothetical protein